MISQHFILTILKILTALAGAYLLFREVRIGHRVEELKELILELKLFQKRAAMLERKLYKDFLISIYVEDLDMDEWEATGIVNPMTSQQIQTAVGQHNSNLIWQNVDLQKLKKKKEAFINYTNGEAVKDRRKALNWGFVLIVLSGVIELVDVTLESHLLFK